jgi:hypothetical protein
MVAALQQQQRKQSKKKFRAEIQQTGKLLVREVLEVCFGKLQLIARA